MPSLECACNVCGIVSRSLRTDPQKICSMPYYYAMKSDCRIAPQICVASILGTTVKYVATPSKDFMT